MTATWLYPAPDVDDLWDLSDLLRRSYGAALALATGMAIVILGGDSDRIGGASFTAVRETGGMLLWGGVFAALAAALVVARGVSRRLLRLALMGGASVYLLWAISLAESAYWDRHAGLTGPVVYAIIAVQHVSQAVEYRRQLVPGVVVAVPKARDSP
ncbi:hypothetical protein [Pseudonocardia sp. T1-2H]|uniref:hypothetical protein n=1 Tax=Pseudonocardia sp. T1-2H TaxID=3128899 RepID=UPI003101108C